MARTFYEAIRESAVYVAFGAVLIGAGYLAKWANEPKERVYENALLAADLDRNGITTVQEWQEVVYT